MKKILVPVDFSDYSETACEYGIEIAGKAGAELNIFHAYADPVSSSPAEFFYFNDAKTAAGHVLQKYEKQAQSSMHLFFTELQGKAHAKYPGLTISYTLAHGEPEDSIVRFAREYAPELIIMGTRSRKIQSHYIWNSLTAGVIEKISIPVLTIPVDSVYNEIRNVLYAAKIEHSDMETLERLAALLKPFIINLKCLHINTDGFTLEDDLIIEDMQEDADARLGEGLVEFEVINADDVIVSIDEYVKKYPIDLIAFSTKKRNLFQKLVDPSMTKKMLFHTQKPMLIFHY